jgi:arylsulfatase A-like enzyme
MKGRAGQDRAISSAFRPMTIGALAVAAVVAASLAIWAPWRAQVDRVPPWNVVVITLDTTRADRLGCYGARHKTPTIDALARQSVRFERCFCPVPLTLPSHCSLMTGLEPVRHGVHDNGPDRLEPGADTLAEVLSGRGYATAAVVGAVVLDRQFGLDQGFDHYDDQMPESAAPSRFRHAQRNAQQVTDAALEWLERQRGAPVFLWVHYFDPHAPYDPPGYNPKLATMEPYDAEIAYLDSQLKRLLDGLEKHLGAQTLVILTADHGEALGEHGELTHGLFTYNSTLRVPLLVRFPGGQHAGRTISSPVGSIDVMPGVLAWLGLEAPGPLDGLPLPLDEASEHGADVGSRAVYFENRFPTSMYGWSAVDGLIAGNLKLIRAPRSELYDLAADPLERNNLFDPADEQSRSLMTMLEEVVARLAARPALSAQTATVSSDDLARLRSLGYVGAARSSPTAAPAPRRNLPDPKDMLSVFSQISDLTVLMDEGQVPRATEMLLAILELSDPANKRALRLLAAMSLDIADSRERVIACLQQAARPEDGSCTDAFVLAKLGAALLTDDRPAEAVEAFERLVQVEPRSAAASGYLAEAHDRLGNTDQARRWRSRASELAKTSNQQSDPAAGGRDGLAEEH